MRLKREAIIVLYLMLTASQFMNKQGNARLIYITPNSDKTPCPDDSHQCLTLSEFARRTGNLSQSMELVLLPLEHHLDFSISVTSISEFTMKSASKCKASQITCQVNKTRFEFKLIGKLLIQGLKFVGCGNNLLEFVQNLTIEHSTFLGQSGSGTALILNETSTEIVNTTFDSNIVGSLYSLFHGITLYAGGAIFATHCKIKVRDSKFLRNHARDFGGAIFTQSGSNITILESSFVENSVCDSISVDSNTQLTCYGGAICHDAYNSQTQYRSQLVITNSTFSLNTASKGAVFTTENSDVDVEFSHFNRNFSPLNIYTGVILDLRGETHLSINGSILCNNNGATIIAQGKSVTLTDSHFQGNTGYLGSVLVSVHINDANLNIKRCHFSNNSAIQGGVLSVEQCNVTVTECEFDNNYVKADPHLPYIVPQGGVINSQNSYITFSKTNFTNNRAVGGPAGVVVLVGNVTLIVDTCSFMDNQALEGGAIAISRSTIHFRGINLILGNHGTFGGGIYTSDNSEINVKGELIISNNTANDCGGGTYLVQSTLRCELGCTITYEHNMADMDGGGLYAHTGSIVSMIVQRSMFRNDPSMYFKGNNAHQGGGVYLALSSTMQIKKFGYWFAMPQYYSLVFTANTAEYGGAVFVNDETYFDICLLQRLNCILQVLSIERPLNDIHSTDAIKFANNSANTAGSVLYGGLLDRCELSKHSEVIIANGGVPVDGITFFKNVTVMSENKGILVSSDPMHVCMCSNGQPDCISTPPTIKVRKGENVSIPVVAVDQIRHSLAKATIFAQLNFTKSGFGVGQLAQVTKGICSNLNFSIFSPYPSEELTLYAYGPCRDTLKSILKLKIVFKECICPVGFYHSPIETDNCVCDCDPQLLPEYITTCDPQSHTLTRHGNSWISYLNTTNDTNQYSYLTYPYCPLDYCLPPDTNVEINLNVEDGSDVQCQNNRSGLLCGVCGPGLSVSLGTSRCISCNGGHNLWWLILIFITAGVVLVVVLWVLNITVTMGTINGLIFYANIIGATSSTFFPTTSTKPVYIIVSWLNLDLGFDACFIDGLDTYMKTWIQMAFPTYVIFLLIIMIVWSEHSLRFARLIGRQNPVALLATLIFISYAKFLQTIITALLFITIEYPDGSNKVVWLPDASVNYLSAKHLILVVVAIVILLVGGVYTILLLFWQWIRKWAIGKISHKACHFFDIYQAPYKLKHRYWPGVLLLARVILYLLFALSQSSDPGANLIGIIIVMCSILLLKGVCGRVYKNKVIDSLESTSYINITTFSTVQLYALQSGKPHNISAFLSVSITAALIVMVVSYHIFTAIVIKIWMKLKLRTEQANARQYESGPVTHNRHREMRPPYYFHDSIEASSVSTSVVEFPGTENSNDHENSEDIDDEGLNAATFDDSSNSANSSKQLLS